MPYILIFVNATASLMKLIRLTKSDYFSYIRLCIKHLRAFIVALDMGHPGLGSTEQEVTTFQRLHPRVYLERFLAEKIRPDGRNLHGFRDIDVNEGSIATANGSSLVRLGNTTVVCGIKAEVAEPELEKPNQGWLVPNVDLPAICSPKFKPGPPGEEAQTLSESINDILHSTGVVPLSSLCIHPGKSAWVLYIDAICINYDGNALDAALIAIVAALKNTTLPEAKYDEDTGVTTCSRATRLPLQIKTIPLAVTFGIFDSQNILPDPTTFEEPLLETSVTVIVNEKNTVLSVSQVGLGLKSPGSQSTLNQCIQLAKERRPLLDKALNG